MRFDWLLRLRPLLLALGALLLLPGCAARYFHDAGTPPPPETRALERWPAPEYWTGIVFNGAKVGFTHFRLAPAAEAPGRFEIRAEASLVLRFLGLDKRIQLKSHDIVRPDLTLERFAYEYVMDDSPLRIHGTAADGQLRLTLVTGGQPVEHSHAFSGPLYPTSAIALYPALQGLAVGRRFEYTVYDGETQRLAQVTQTVEGYEGSQLFEGSAFRIRTELHGLSTTTWLDDQARPVFELALNGVLISALEDEQTARKYLVAASLNKQEAMVDFSRIRADRPLARPRAVTALELTLQDAPALPPSDEWQRCEAAAQGARCLLRAADAAALAARPAAADPGLARYLLPSTTVQSQDPNLRKLAREIAGAESGALAQAQRIVQWLQANVRREPVDVFSALDVLHTRRAECQGHAYLYAALARALGIPTRIVSGLVYSEELEGFLYHSWAESRVGDGWLPLDPTFGQVPADATHVKLLEGDTLADLIPLLDWVGKVGARIGAVSHRND